MGKIPQTLSAKAYYILCSGIFLIYLVYYLPAVCDLTHHAYWVFMDERISYEGVRNIYHSNSFKNFLLNVSYGHDLRYGRMFWMLNAITSYIPYIIWGDQGQLIATRITGLLLLTGSYLILVNLFIKNNNYVRLLVFSFLLFLPLTQYFAIEPKPEPAQLFAFSLFLYFALKKDWAVAPYIILLGLSVGLKISFVPLMLCFIVWYMYKNWDAFFIKKHLTKNQWLLFGLISVLLILLVYCLFIEPAIFKLLSQRVAFYKKLQSRPPLLKTFIALDKYMFGYSFVQRVLFASTGAILISGIIMLLYKFLSNSFFKMFLYILAGIIICTPIILLMPVNLQYLGFYIANNKTSHPNDDITVNYLSWIRFTFTDVFKAPFAVVIAFIFIPFIAWAKTIYEKRKVDVFTLVLLLGLSLLLLAPIYLKVQRLWAHYLFTGIVFYVLFYFASIKYEINKYLRAIYYICPLILFVFLAMQAKTKLDDYKKRTQADGFTASEKEYQQTVNYINKSNVPKAKILWDALLFFPDKISPKDTVNVFFGYFNDWKAGADFIVLKKTLADYDAKKAKHTYVFDSYTKATGDFAFWTDSVKKADRPYYYKRILPQMGIYKIYKKVQQ